MLLEGCMLLGEKKKKCPGIGDKDGSDFNKNYLGEIMG